VSVKPQAINEALAYLTVCGFLILEQPVLKKQNQG
jgi:hypothetical protein